MVHEQNESVGVPVPKSLQPDRANQVTWRNKYASGYLQIAGGDTANKVVCQGQRWGYIIVPPGGELGMFRQKTMYGLSRWPDTLASEVFLFLPPPLPFGPFTSFILSFSLFFSGLLFISLYLLMFSRINCFFLAKHLLLFCEKVKDRNATRQKSEGSPSPQSYSRGPEGGFGQRPPHGLLPSLCCFHTAFGILRPLASSGTGRNLSQPALGYLREVLAGRWYQFPFSPVEVDSLWHSLPVWPCQNNLTLPVAGNKSYLFTSFRLVSVSAAVYDPACSPRPAVVPQLSCPVSQTLHVYEERRSPEQRATAGGFGPWYWVIYRQRYPCWKQVISGKKGAWSSPLNSRAAVGPRAEC